MLGKLLRQHEKQGQGTAARSRLAQQMNIQKNRFRDRGRDHPY
jgi:hypothetical protein